MTATTKQNGKRKYVSVSAFIKKQRTDNTRKAYKIALNRFLAFTPLKEKQLLKLDVEEAEDLLVEFKEALMKEELAGSTIKLWFRSVKAWFKENKIKVDIVCKGVDTEKTYYDYIPTKSDLKELLQKANREYKVLISLMAFSGMRPVDASLVQFKHIKKSYTENHQVYTMIIKQKKTKGTYFTYLGPEGIQYIKKLLEYRQKQGEKITDESFIFSINGKQMNEKTVRSYMRRLINRTIGFHPTNEHFRLFRTYGLRKYFRRWASVIGNDEAEFLMGHKSGRDNLSAVYRGLTDLDPVVIEQLKALYTDNLTSLETELSELTIKSEIDELKESLSKKEDEINQLKARLNGSDDLKAYLPALELLQSAMNGHLQSKLALEAILKR